MIRTMLSGMIVMLRRPSSTLGRIGQIYLALAVVLSMIPGSSIAERMVLVKVNGGATEQLYKESDGEIRPADTNFYSSFWAYLGTTTYTGAAAVSFDGDCNQEPGPNFKVVFPARYGTLSFSTASMPVDVCGGKSMTWTTVNYTWTTNNSDPTSCSAQDSFEVMYPGAGILGSGILFFFPTANFAPRVMFASPPSADPLDITCNGNSNPASSPYVPKVAAGQAFALSLRPSAPSGSWAFVPPGYADPPPPPPVGGYSPTVSFCSTTAVPGKSACPTPLSLNSPNIKAYFLTAGPDGSYQYTLQYGQGANLSVGTVYVVGPRQNSQFNVYPYHDGCNGTALVVSKVAPEATQTFIGYGARLSNPFAEQRPIGITFDAQHISTNPQIDNGQFSWAGQISWTQIQNIDNESEWNGRSWIKNPVPSIGVPGLDGQISYPPFTPTSTGDNPATSLDESAAEVFIQQQYMMFLLWKPISENGVPIQDSIDVPLGYTEWGYTADIVKGAPYTGGATPCAAGHWYLNKDRSTEITPVYKPLPTYPSWAQCTPSLFGKCGVR